jgi:ferredoxin-NADP reductase
MNAIIQDIRWETESVFMLRILPEGGVFPFKAGQFLQVMVNNNEGKQLRKSYSIISPPFNTDHIELCVKLIPGGFTSNYLAKLKPGSTIEIAGPFGKFTLQHHANDIIFVATGTGISAPKPMIEALLKENFAHDIWLFFGVRTKADLIYRALLEQLAKGHKNFHFVPVLSAEKAEGFEYGRVQDAIRKHIIHQNQNVYICGLFTMVDEVRTLLRELGFPDEKLHYEKYV